MRREEQESPIILLLMFNSCHVGKTMEMHSAGLENESENEKYTIFSYT